uniref:Uncharacterized protein n=1 Tax=Steinernema glaseri TaxID=37863 RepID=A0A1I7YYY3_9BILA
MHGPDPEPSGFPTRNPVPIPKLRDSRPEIRRFGIPDPKSRPDPSRNRDRDRDTALSDATAVRYSCFFGSS